MSDFSALAYLQWRQATNRLRQLSKDPKRVVIWLLAFVALALMVTARIVGGGRAANANFGVRDPFATLIFFGLLAAFGVVLLSSAFGRVASFASLTDARFLSGSAMRERNVIVWLQLRSCFGMLGRFAYLIVLYAFIFPTAGRTMPMLAAMVASVAVLNCTGIPMLKLRTRVGPVPGVALACFILAIGLVPLGIVVAGWAAPWARPLSGAIVALGTGHIVTSALLGNWIPILALFVFAAALVAVAAAGADDLYPELYRGSVAFLETRGGSLAALRGRRESSQRGNAPTIARSASAPARGFTGAWAILWRDRVFAMRRRGLGRFGRIAGLVGAALLGLALGRFALTGPDHALAMALTGSLTFVAVMVLSMLSTNSLADDLGKPLWWLTASTLRERLYVWLLSRSSFLGTFFAIVLAVYVLSLGLPALMIPALVTGVVLALYINAVGLLLYGFFPARVDQRGPGSVLRPLMLYAMLVPVIVAALTALILTHSRAIAGELSLLVACGEIALMVEGAALRLHYSGATAQRAEES